MAAAGDSFDRQPHTRARGRWGEDAASQWLKAHGYRIVERNFSTRYGEIDVVARDGGTLCFIEIKARTSDHYGGAIEAVTERKQRRLARAAAFYLLRHPTEDPCRFDVLAMDREAGRWRFTLLRDAFMSAP